MSTHQISPTCIGNLNAFCGLGKVGWNFHEVIRSPSEPNSRLNQLPQQGLPIFSLIFRLQDELLKDSLHAIGLASF